MQFPPFTGLFDVGTTDIHTDTVLFRLFYPCRAPGTTKTQWMPDVSLYTSGYIHFLKAPRMFSLILRPLVSFVKTNMWMDAPLLNVEDGHVHTFPVMVFSHGLGGMRTAYSHVCAEFASHGIIVAACEHRDGSASVAYHPDEPIFFRRPLAADTPSNMTVDEYYLKYRRDQLNLKVKEVEEILDVLKTVNEFDEETIRAALKPTEHIPVNFETLASFKGKFDFSNLVMAGHSFGAATALSAMQSSKYKFKCGIVYDPWMHAVSLDHPTSSPILSIQSETFHWRPNLISLYQHFKNLEKADESVFMMVHGTCHQDFSDFAILFPRLLRYVKLAGMNDPAASMKVWLNASLAFLSRNIKELPCTVLGHDNHFSEALAEDRWNGSALFGDKAYEHLLANCRETWS